MNSKLPTKKTPNPTNRKPTQKVLYPKPKYSQQDPNGWATAGKENKWREQGGERGKGGKKKKSCFVTLNVIEESPVLLTLLDVLSLYLEKYTLLIRNCCWCPALVKTTICQALHKVLQNDRSGCLNRWSPRKNRTDRKFMTLNYIKATSVNIMSKARRRRGKKTPNQTHQQKQTNQQTQNCSFQKGLGGWLVGVGFFSPPPLFHYINTFLTYELSVRKN